MSNDKKHILVVDSDPEILEIANQKLYEFFEESAIQLALNGELALEAINNGFRPSLIMTALDMPKMNGVCLLKRLLKEHPTIPVMLLLSPLDIEKKIENIELGFDSIIEKPIDFSKLTDEVYRLTNTKKLHHEKHISVTTKQLMGWNKYPYDIFLLLKEKVVHIFKEGDPTSPEKLEHFLEKGGKGFFIKASDYLEIDESLYTPFRSSTLRTDDLINFTIFYLNPDQSYQELLPKGTLILKEHIIVLKKFDIKKMYIRDDDELAYQEYLDVIVSRFLKEKKVALEDKAIVVSQYAQHNLMDAYKNTSEATLKKAQEVGLVLREFVKDNSMKGVASLINAQKKNNIYGHSLNVAAITLSIYDEIIRRHNDKNLASSVKMFADVFSAGANNISRELLVMSALLHDIGNASSKIYSQKSKEPYLHVEVGVELLQGKKAIPDKVIEIISEHEEFCDGTGGPAKKFKSTLSVYAQIISLANFYEPLNKDDDLPKSYAMDFIHKNSSKFNKHLIQILQSII